MKLQVSRAKNIDTDRRGNIRNVGYTLTFHLMVSSDEMTAIQTCGLRNQLLYQLQAKVIYAHELIEAGAKWSGLSLPAALSVQNSMVESCESFAQLVRTGMMFDGHIELELSPA